MPLMNRELHQYPLTILERHLDTFGHVNNATYLEIFEEARWDWITRAGFGMTEIHRLRQSPVVLECRVKFLRELRQRQPVVVVTEAIDYVGKIGRLRQCVRLADTDRVACDAEFVVGLFDLERRKLIDPTPQWLEVVGMTREHRPAPEQE